MTWLETFALVGVIITIFIMIIVVYAVLQAIKEKIEKAIYRYKVKHRFDKPPTAKCYCVDCQRYEPRGKYPNGRCCKFDGWSVADNWFCWDATPRKKAGGQE
jgi:hypothetical protein